MESIGNVLTQIDKVLVAGNGEAIDEILDQIDQMVIAGNGEAIDAFLDTLSPEMSAAVLSLMEPKEDGVIPTGAEEAAAQLLSTITDGSSSENAIEKMLREALGGLGSAAAFGPDGITNSALDLSSMMNNLLGEGVDMSEAFKAMGGMNMEALEGFSSLLSSAAPSAPTSSSTSSSSQSVGTSGKRVPLVGANEDFPLTGRTLSEITASESTYEDTYDRDLLEYEVALDDLRDSTAPDQLAEQEQHVIYMFFNKNLTAIVDKLKKKKKNDIMVNLAGTVLAARIATSKSGPMELWNKHMKSHEKLFEKLTPETFREVIRIAPSCPPLKIFSIDKRQHMFRDEEIEGLFRDLSLLNKISTLMKMFPTRLMSSIQKMAITLKEENKIDASTSQRMSPIDYIKVILGEFASGRFEDVQKGVEMMGEQVKSLSAVTQIKEIPALQKLYDVD